MVAKNTLYTRCFKWSVSISVTLIVFYLLTREFFAADSGSLLVPVDVLAVLIFAVIVIRSIIFGVANRNKLKLAYLPLIINATTIITLVYLLPSLSTGKLYHKRLVRQLNLNELTCGCRLYTDHYLVSDGFFTGNITAGYLIDGKTFRQYIGNYDNDYESFKINCYGNSIIVLKINDATADTTRHVYNLSKLKTDGDFD